VRLSINSMSRRTPNLRFDKRREGWVENPKSWLQELNERTDDFHVGLVFGIAIAGVLWSIIVWLAVVLIL